MKILYICTHNRCRSILSEAITNHFAQPHLTARSAGSQPAGVVHPLSLQYLAEAGIATAGLKSQSWDDFEDFEPDVVITLCDSAAGESCPVWFGKAIKLHWGLQDPSKLSGDEAQAAAAFRHTIALIRQRVEGLEKIAVLERENWSAALQKLTTAPA
ncbi:arsenate reductase [Oceanococcus atlanticus]|uniref:Arsenate reductase n=1 Tax=Oceanococcus atlanticus TaxID=1317117 RepID=A0A1Y1SF08_9GAMM|nr:arsenate reductase ArsC [Oceanococcus atlanticus]ORE87112.1 arsenate reductase [Oceanococcus atlanticus]RZO86856.1 MAG: arsenate reductase ArsC [Oceanococcus sp.]